MTAVVDIVSLKVEACHGNQPNRSRLALYNGYCHFKSCLKQLYISNKMEHFSYKCECSVHGCMHIEAFNRRANSGYI